MMDAVSSSSTEGHIVQGLYGDHHGSATTTKVKNAS
jgi:hypothetical protein